MNKVNPVRQTYNEWFKGKTSLFEAINELLPVTIFDENDIDSMDAVFCHLYGERFIPKAMLDDTVSEVAKKIVAINRNKWIKSYELLYNELESGVANLNTVEDTRTNTNNRILDRNTKENVSAFNDVDYSPDSENVEGLTDENNSSETATRTETRKSLWAIQQQFYMARSDFLNEVVLKDISKVVTLPIY